ncbi:MAG: NusA N-terminal domain-containing protein, partial [Candidatus Margulisiibacteriota bacterium]
MISVEGLPLILSQIEKERGIPRDVIIEALKASLHAASKKMFTEEVWLELTVNLDEANGKLSLMHGDKEVTPENESFGRLAAQTAKQVILQRIREAEKNSIFDEFTAKEGSILTGTVQRVEGSNYLINLGRIEAVLRYQDQIHKERYNPKEKIRVYVAGTSQTA